MRSPYLRKVAFVLTLIGFIAIQYFIFKKANIQKDFLIEVSGTITNVEKVNNSLRHARFPYAFAMKIEGTALKFGINEQKQGAFFYIKNNAIIGKNATILYDKYAINPKEGITFHVKHIEIDGVTIWNMEKAMKAENMVLYIFLVLDIFLVIIVILIYRRRKKDQEKAIEERENKVKKERERRKQKRKQKK
jgi:cbb3-type cytochrome oxidase subunit 3